MRYCSKCLAISVRPRITFDERGVCNACQWAETKKTKIDWKKRWQTLEEICDKYRRTDGSNWDVLVPCSGGKDGSYVAWRMKHDLGMHPLCVTLMPQVQTEVGRRNLENFQKSGFDHIAIRPNPQVYSRLAKKGLKEQGRPQLPFVTGVFTVTIKTAIKFDIPFIVYGEEGESEYGGAMTQAHRPKINRECLVKYYYSGHDTTKYLNEFTKDELRWWLLPTQEEMEKIDLFLTHWSHYENWDPSLHARLAREKCGFQGLNETSIATFTDYAQLDDIFRDLHVYLMYLKFGFGRASGDAMIEIREGRMSRKEGVELAKKYDGVFPEIYLRDYLDFFQMPEKEFLETLDSFANREILEKTDGRWRLRPEVLKALEEGCEWEPAGSLNVG